MQLICQNGLNRDIGDPGKYFSELFNHICRVAFGR